MTKDTCEMCEDDELTEERIKEYLRKQCEIIEQNGRVLQHVFASEEAPQFTYTIGNYRRHGLPELLLIGSKYGSYLNELSEEMIRRGKPFDSGETFKGADLNPRVTSEVARVKVIDAHPVVQDLFTCQAGEAPVQQVILSDFSGRFPDEEGCAEPFASQPIYRRTTQ
jgi:Domain of unknown function (DUF4262)